MVAATQLTTDQQRLDCPRCESGMVANYDELECMICGYVDYSWTPPVRRPRRINNGSEVRFRLPYVGEFQSMKGNFVLARFHDEAEAGVVDEHLKSNGIIVRRVGGYGFPHCLRITVGDEPSCRRVAHLIGEIKGVHVDA